MSHITEWLSSAPAHGDLSVVPPACTDRRSVLSADEEDICPAVMRLWGCDQPTPEAEEALRRRKANAEVLLRDRLDPECSALGRDDVFVDCTDEPCFMVYTSETGDGLPYCFQGGTWTSTAQENGMYYSAVPLIPLSEGKWTPPDDQTTSNIKHRFLASLPELVRDLDEQQ